MAIDISKLPDLANKSTGLFEYLTNLIAGSINWVLNLPLYVKFCIFLIIVFVMYVSWEINNYIKYLQKQHEKEQKLRGYSTKNI